MNYLVKFFKDWGKAFAVCYPMMVEGNLSALTFKHFWIANITGLTAAILALVIGLIFVNENWEKFKWYNPLVLACGTFVADLFAHPSHFWGSLGEATLTGIGTFALAMFFAYRGK